MPKTPVTITAIWLRHNNHQAQVLAEIDGRWHLVCAETIDERSAPFGHIAEGNGAKNWPLDPLTEVEQKPARPLE